MASPTTTADAAIPDVKGADENYLTHDKGFASWAFTLDHKRIGVMYLASVLTAFALGGLFALLVRTELWSPGETIMKHDTYNQMFTLHGAIMLFLVIIPGIPAALGNIILPLHLGAKDVAFPKLNLASYYLWIIGCLCMLGSLVTNAVDTGWTFYAPYSTTTQTNVLPPAFGAVSEIIPTFSRKRLFGYQFIAISSLAIAFLGFLVWGHHMFTSGQSVLAGTIFSAITFLIAIPTAIKIFNWVSTMYKGRIHLDTPMLYALAFLWVFTIGGLTGVFL